MLSSSINLRKEIAEAWGKCSVAGCNDLPTDRLPDRMQVRDLFWCKPHADMLAAKISKKDYEDFVEALRKQGITENPTLTDGRMDKVKNRHCCVPRCNGGVITQASFEPYKQPGTAWTCDRHEFAVHYVSSRLNGRRLINDMAQRSTSRKEADPIAEKRKTTILALCAKLSGERNYIEQTCRELQRQKIPLLANWVKDWNRDHKLGLQNWDWFVAYDSGEKAVRDRIQHYISAICNPRVRSHLNPQ